ncbi:hypothetical protein F5X96DRAFT_676758 [Biscogniauxia mediterranea]|nr:hypothetical protein F5X96DRAFT_676758 [Biscogniauxia mediterranea]
MFWPQILMNIMGEHPRGCELDILTALAAQECDGDSKVRDGIVSDPKPCSFDLFPHMGARFSCLAENGSMVTSRAVVAIAHASWAVPTDVVSNFLYDVTGTRIAATNFQYGIYVKAILYPLAYQGIQLFVEKNPEYNYSAITWEEFGEVMRKSGAEYDSVVASRNPDRTEFYEAGGKMLTYHGPYDQIIPIRAMEDCYDSIREFVPNPTTVFGAMRAWIENGTAPESLPTTFIDGYERINNRIICSYPERAVLKEDCGRTTDSACFVCVGSQIV